MAHYMENSQLYRQVAQFCADANMLPPLEIGDRIVWKGQIYLVLEEDQGDLAVLDEWMGDYGKLEKAHIADWKNDPSCIPLFNMPSLLQLIHGLTGTYPAMTPGIRMSSEVWQVKHPSAESIVSDDLHTALLRMIVHLFDSRREIEEKM